MPQVPAHKKFEQLAPRLQQHTKRMVEKYGILFEPTDDLEWFVPDSRPIHQRSMEEVLSVFEEPDEHGFRNMCIANSTFQRYHRAIKLITGERICPNHGGAATFIDAFGTGMSLAQVKDMRAAVSHVHRVLGADAVPGGERALEATCAGHRRMFNDAIKAGELPPGRPIFGFSFELLELSLSIAIEIIGKNSKDSLRITTALVVMWAGGFRIGELDTLRRSQFHVDDAGVIHHRWWRHKQAAAARKPVEVERELSTRSSVMKVIPWYLHSLPTADAALFPVGTSQRLGSLLATRIIPAMKAKGLIPKGFRASCHSYRVGAAQDARVLAATENRREYLDAVRLRTGHETDAMAEYYSRPNDARLAEGPIFRDELAPPREQAVDGKCENDKEDLDDELPTSSAAACAPTKRRSRGSKKTPTPRVKRATPKTKTAPTSAGARRGRSSSSSRGKRGGGVGPATPTTPSPKTDTRLSARQLQRSQESKVELDVMRSGLVVRDQKR